MSVCETQKGKKSELTVLEADDNEHNVCAGRR